MHAWAKFSTNGTAGDVRYAFIETQSVRSGMRTQSATENGLSENGSRTESHVICICRDYNPSPLAQKKKGALFVLKNWQRAK